MNERSPTRSTVFIQLGWPLVARTERIVPREEQNDCHSGDIRIRSARFRYRVRIGWLSDTIASSNRQQEDQS